MWLGKSPHSCSNESAPIQDFAAMQEALHDDIAAFLEAVALRGARLVAAGGPSKGTVKRSVADEAQLMQCTYLQLRA